MIPVVLGTIASSRRGSDSYTVAVDCAGNAPYTIYVLPGQPISTGTNTIVYTNNSLTTLLTNTSFVYLNYTYAVDSNGLIYYAAVCYRSWVTYADCNSYRDGGTPTTYYTRWVDSTLQNGVPVYTDSTLTTYAGSITFTYSGMVYVLTAGVITSTAVCGYSWPYSNSGCGQVDTALFYTTTTSISIGTIIYNSPDLQGRITVNIYRYGYNTYFGMDVDGVVESINSCPT